MHKNTHWTSKMEMLEHKKDNCFLCNPCYRSVNTLIFVYFMCFFFAVRCEWMCDCENLFDAGCSNTLFQHIVHIVVVVIISIACHINNNLPLYATVHVVFTRSRLASINVQSFGICMWVESEFRGKGFMRLGKKYHILCSHRSLCIHFGVNSWTPHHKLQNSPKRKYYCSIIGS